MEERTLSYKIEVINMDNQETIYNRDFATQEILEEHLREMESEVKIYLNQVDIIEKELEAEDEEDYNPFGGLPVEKPF